ncbi:MAG: hypothetical protein IK015_12110, partial [Treponema sp.]|nr:hypothetical protein [Treponema sp.]
SSQAKEIASADQALTQKMARQFFVLARAKSFESAKNAADVLAVLALQADPDKKIFESLSLGADGSALDQILEWHYKNRFLLLDKETVAKIYSPGGIDELKEEALQKAFGAFTLTPLEYIEGDPFFLADMELQKLIDALSKTGTSLALRDGVLAAEHDGWHYVMVRGALTQKGAAITNKTSGVRLIYDCANKAAKVCAKKALEDQDCAAGGDDTESGDVSFVFSGTPFHSYQSSSSAQRQVGIITALSVLAVVALLLFVFRSALPLLFSVGAISLSAVFGLCAELLAFGQIHVLTFVFGTTLIGTCLDYSVHFWTRARFGAEADGAQIRNKLFKGLLLSFSSTELCYLLMLFAPFALLKQISVFCFAGILSAFLTTLLFYPCLRLRGSCSIAGNGASAFNQGYAGIKGGTQIVSKTLTAGGNGPKIIFALAFVFLALAIGFRKNLRLDNDLRKFYTMSGKLLDDEILSAKVTKRNASAWYYIVRGRSPQELLQNEERFCDLLDQKIAEGSLESYAATCRFVPSKQSQERSLLASQKLMANANDLLEAFGYPPSDFAADLAAARKLLEQDSAADLEQIPDYLKSVLSALWIGKVGDEYFSVVMPTGGSKDGAQVAADVPNIYFVNKMQSVEFELNRLTKIMLALMAAAFGILVCALAFFYKPKVLARVAAVPLFVLLCEAGMIAALKIPLGFFCVTGIILVFGLGLDYIIYTVESGGDKVNGLAVLISFATTALSFGAIALSSFMPVHIFGAVVFIGLVAAWGSSRLLSN